MSNYARKTNRVREVGSHKQLAQSTADVAAILQQVLGRPVTITASRSPTIRYNRATFNVEIAVDNRATDLGTKDRVIEEVMVYLDGLRHTADIAQGNFAFTEAAVEDEVEGSSETTEVVEQEQPESTEATAEAEGSSETTEVVEQKEPEAAEAEAAEPAAPTGRGRRGRRGADTDEVRELQSA